MGFGRTAVFLLRSLPKRFALMNIVLSLGMIWRVRAKPTADKAVSHSKASHMTARGAEVLDLVAVGAVPWLEDALPLVPLLQLLLDPPGCG